MLVLGNKIDRPEAISEGGLRGAFALDGQVTGKVSLTFQFSEIIQSLHVCVWAHVRCPHLSLLLSTGKRLIEGAECSTAGDFHVQRVEKTRLWGGFQMVITIHRLTRGIEALPEGIFLTR